MMRLDRGLQKEILNSLGDAFPGAIQDLVKTLALPDGDDELMRFLANLTYLEEHGLISNGYKLHSFLSGEITWSNNRQTRITAAGLDFIADDGGMGAILNTVTVRLDAGQFAELLAAKVESLPGIEPEERSEIAKAIRKMPATAIEKLTEKLLDWSVDHAGDALHIVRAALGALG